MVLDFRKLHAVAVDIVEAEQRAYTLAVRRTLQRIERSTVTLSHAMHAAASALLGKAH